MNKSKKPYKLTLEQELEACKIYQEQTISAHNIGKLFNVSERPVLSAFKKHGIKIKSTFDHMSHKFTLEQVNKITNDYNSGKNIKNIAKEYGLTSHTIKKHLIKWGVSLRERKKIPQSEHVKIIKYYTEDYLSAQEIADKYGVSHGTILPILWDNNVQMKKFGEGSKLFTPLEESEICLLYKSTDMTMVDIGKKYNSSPTVIKRVLIDNDIPVIKRNVLILPEEEIIELYLSGIDQKEISEIFHCSDSPIRKILIKNNIEIRTSQESQGTSLTEEKIDIICELYQKVLNQNKVQEQLGFSVQTITNALKRRGIKILSVGEVKRARLNDSEKLKVLNLFDSGIEYTRICRELGYGTKIIKKFLIESGRKYKSYLTEDDKREIIDEYCDDGQSVAQIAKNWEIGRKTVTSILKSINIEIKPAGSYRLQILTDEEISGIVNDYNNIMTLHNIYEKYDTSQQRVKGILLEHGVRIRPAIENFIHHHNTLDSRRSSLKGWYKHYYFRSLNELSFIINYLEVKYKEDEWVSGEKPEHKILYDHPEGRDAYYFPDFILKGKYIFECKPKFYWNNEIVLAKKSAAEIVAENLGMKYVLVDYPVKKEKIIEQYNLGNIRPSPSSMGRFETRLNIKEIITFPAPE